MGDCMKARLYDSAAMAKIGASEKYGHGFSASLDASLEALRLDRLSLIEETAWNLVRRFVGPRCPLDAVDALTCVNLMGAEIRSVTYPSSGRIEFCILRGEEIVDSESVPFAAKSK